MTEVLTTATSPETAGLPRNSVYRSVAARAEYQAAYDRVIARLPFETRGLDVTTRFGRTHLTLAGDPVQRPLIVLPGMSISGPLMLEYCARHARDRLLIAPDLIGHPGRSEDRLHPLRDHGYGRWLAEVLDALKIERADILSGSFGSSHALDLAAWAPERVRRQALMMPAGLTPRIPYWTIHRRFVFPWLAYRIHRDKARLPALAAPLADGFGQNDYDYLDVVIRCTAFWRHRPAGPFLPRDLSGYREPVLLVTAGRDIVFPRRLTLPNALAALNVVESIYLPESAHVPDGRTMAPVHEKIAEFLAT
jgi:pimeloyl-ACP methyl ester carboxylesterase